MDAQSSTSYSEMARIKQVLNDYPNIRLAILFGSLASGSAKHDSDLDLAVDMGGRALEQKEKIQLIAELAVALGRPVDLVDLFSAGEPLLGQIISRGKRLLGDDTRYAFILSKHLFNQADFMPYRSRILSERRRAWIDS